MTTERLPKPLLVVLSAPSGAGKSTLCRYLREVFENLVYSVSCTTRPPRGRERDGESYYFLDRGEFKRRVAAGEFLESALVHGHYYGTLKSTVRDAMARGLSVLMDVDVQGAAQIREALRRDSVLRGANGRLVDIFVRPPSLAALRRRLVLRGEDSGATIAERLASVAAEMAMADAYRYTVVNDCLETAQVELAAILRSAASSVADAGEEA
jgi:guanylate kinase